MGETETKHEDKQHFSAYFGTTLENFLTCAQIDDQGVVVFIKRKELKHVEPNAMQFIYGLAGGARYAFTRAKELGHTPLIIEGELDKQRYPLKQELLPGEPFPVKQVWIPREGIDWKMYDPFVDNNNPEFTETRRVFGAKNPIDLLQPTP